MADYGISAHGYATQTAGGEKTGVWVTTVDSVRNNRSDLTERKIASVGVGIKNWVTLHGAALNLYFDASAFQGMRPCGFSPEVMIDIESIVGVKIPREKILEKLSSYFSIS